MDQPYLYQGNKLETARQINGRFLEAYIPSAELIEAVNLAILLERPLLLMGEPGSGKTRLAEAVAYELHGEQYQEFFFPWYIKSTSKAKDGLYQIDSLGRLRDASANHPKARNVENYLTPGVLSKAFKISSPDAPPPVVLIDEVDKAAIDFPNDLLLELDRGEYVIEELNNLIIPGPERKPLIFITSNREKELPPAFLRRCLFHFIEFPKRKQMQEILDAHFDELVEGDQETAIKTFYNLRNRMKLTAGKLVTTSELINWFTVLQDCRRWQKKKADGKEISTAQEKLLKRFERWINADRPDEVDILELPFHQILLKGWQNHLDYMHRKED